MHGMARRRTDLRMKLSRIPAIGAAVALVATSTLLFASPAAAADFYYDQDDFGQELLAPNDGYPAGVDWFYGAQPVNPLGDLDWTVRGIEINNGTNPSGAVQILNQDVTTPAAGGLATLVFNSFVVSATGEWTFQLPLFANPTTGPQAFTTLRPAAQGNNATVPSAAWITSGAIPTDGGGVAYAAGATATLTQFETALNALASYELLAFGLNFTAADTDTVQAVRWDGDWSIFTAEPTITPVPDSIQLADFVNPAKGVTVTATGFLPGEETYWRLVRPNGAVVQLGSVFADANGVAVFDHLSLAGAAAGEYGLSVDSDYFRELNGITVEGSFEVTPTALAATGTDATGAGIVAGVLLITGLGVLIARRRVGALR
jgi:LPXTG-motif cell wall-anchored protein